MSALSPPFRREEKDLPSHASPRWAILKWVCRSTAWEETSFSPAFTIPNRQCSAVPHHRETLPVRPCPGGQNRTFQATLAAIFALAEGCLAAHGKHHPIQQCPTSAHLQLCPFPEVFSLLHWFFSYCKEKVHFLSVPAPKRYCYGS